MANATLDRMYECSVAGHAERYGSLNVCIVFVQPEMDAQIRN